MAISDKRKKVRLARRRSRIRKVIVGTSERPRLVVKRTLRHIEAQIVDDRASHSVVGLSTLSKDLQGDFANRIEQGRALGKLLASKAADKGVKEVVFDRAGRMYHGIIKAVADGAREGGLQF